MRDTNTDQAIVLGASMAGLLAARVLLERFKQVVVIDRDALPPVVGHRRGVPHGRHIHALHPRGLEILDELFPGISTSLAADGAVLCDVVGDVRWQLSGYQLRQAQSGLPVVFAAGRSLRAMSARWYNNGPKSVFSRRPRLTGSP